MEERLKVLEQRLTRSEHELHMMRRGALLALLLFMISIVARPAETKVQGSQVKAPFRIVDDRGKTLLQVGQLAGRYTTSKTTRAMRLFDATGNAVVEISADHLGGSLDIYNSNGWAAASLSAGGGGHLVMLDKEGGWGAEVRGGTDGGSVIVREKGWTPSGGFASSKPSFLSTKEPKNIVELRADDVSGHMIITNRHGDIVFQQP